MARITALRWNAGNDITSPENQPLVQATNGALYSVFFESGSSATGDLKFAKSTDGGKTWALTTLSTGAMFQAAVWYDRWTPGLTTDLIHVVCTESVLDDIQYISIDTAAADATHAVGTVFAGASAVGGNGTLSLTRSRGGDLYCAFMIDAAAEYGFATLPSANVGTNTAWTLLGSNAANVEKTPFNGTPGAAAADKIILMPGFAADNQDIIAFFWDETAAIIYRMLWDDSAETWSETSLATSMAQLGTRASSWAAACDHANSQNLLIAWSNVDTPTASLRVWKVTESAITECANHPIASSAGEQGYCAISIETTTGTWYALYAGGAAFQTVVNVHYKSTADGGATAWGAETTITDSYFDLQSLVTIPRFAVSTTGGVAGPAFKTNTRGATWVIGIELPAESAGGAAIYGAG